MMTRTVGGNRPGPGLWVISAYYGVGQLYPKSLVMIPARSSAGRALDVWSAISWAPGPFWVH